MFDKLRWHIREHKKKYLIATTVITIASISAYFIPQYINNKEGIIIVAKACTDKDNCIELKADGDYIYREDSTTGEKEKTLISVSEPKQIAESANKEIFDNYEMYPDSDIVDPTSVGFLEDIPNNYASDLSLNYKYINTMEHEGWVIKGVYCKEQYCEYFIEKDENYLRIISSENNLKIYRKSQGEIYEPTTYISEE